MSHYHQFYTYSRLFCLWHRNMCSRPQRPSLGQCWLLSHRACLSGSMCSVSWAHIQPPLSCPSSSYPAPGFWASLNIRVLFLISYICICCSIWLFFYIPIRIHLKSHPLGKAKGLSVSLHRNFIPSEIILFLHLSVSFFWGEEGTQTEDLRLARWVLSFISSPFFPSVLGKYLQHSDLHYL